MSPNLRKQERRLTVAGFFIIHVYAISLHKIIV
jgi:hypothetical protein